MREPTFTIFSDANSPRWAEGFAELLRQGSTTKVDIVDSLDEALDGDADVLILNLRRRGDEKLSAERVASLGKRRVIAMAPGVDWLCAQLDEIEFRGSNVAGDLTMLAVDSELLGERLETDPIRPFEKIQDAPSAEWTAQTPNVYFCSGNVSEYRPEVDYILVAEKLEQCAVVMRHANFVFAGVRAHPVEWSEQYRALMARVAVALARRPVEELSPIIVERQIHPPGTVRFDLEPTAAQSACFRTFYFRFERPTAFVFDMRDGTVGVDGFHDRVKARYGATFTMEQLIEFADDFTDDLRDTVTGALTGHRARDDLATFSGEHLLLALLDNTIAVHAMKCAGVDVDYLRSELNELLDTQTPEVAVGQGVVFKTVCGAVYRANFIGALGREGTNAANLLAGLLGESCDATNLLDGRGVRQRDVVNYVTHGIPSVAVEGQQPGASVLDEALERASHAAFAKARQDRLRYVSVELLLLALLADAHVDGLLVSLDAGKDELHEELGAFNDATSVVAGDDEAPQPTRTFNRVMQMAVVKARSYKRDRASTLDALWALCGERDVPVAAFLERHGIDRADVAARMAEAAR